MPRSVTLTGAVLIQEANQSHLEALTRFQVAMALETENERLDPDTVRKGVSHVLQRRQSHEGTAKPSEIPFYLVMHHSSDESSQKAALEQSHSQNPFGCCLIQSEWSDWRNGVVWWIHSVYLEPGERGKGYFSELYAHIETMARLQAVRGLRLFVDKRNVHAQKVYAKLGMGNEHYDLFEKLF